MRAQPGRRPGLHRRAHPPSEVGLLTQQQACSFAVLLNSMPSMRNPMAPRPQFLSTCSILGPCLCSLLACAASASWQPGELRQPYDARSRHARP